MKTIRSLLMVLAMMSVVGVIYAHDEDFRPSTNGDYKDGYVQGFQHGGADRFRGANFNYRHDPEYGTSEQEHMTDDARQNCNFRVGYVEGYVDGYFNRSPQVGQLNDYSGYRQDNRSGYENGYNNGGSYNGSGYNNGYASVTVFTDTEYRGQSYTFRPGQYSSFTSSLNDNIDSVRINGNIRVILFADKNFKGDHVVLDRESTNLSGFRNKAGSMIVELRN